MTQILNVSRNNDGQYEIVDQHGKIVEGPFDTNAAAWKALDRLDNDMLLDGRRSNEKVLWGKPDPKKSKRGRRKEKKRQEQMTAKQEHRMKVNAAKAPGWVRSVARRSSIQPASANSAITSLGRLAPHPRSSVSTLNNICAREAENYE